MNNPIDDLFVQFVAAIIDRLTPKSRLGRYVLTMVLFIGLVMVAVVMVGSVVNSGGQWIVGALALLVPIAILWVISRLIHARRESEPEPQPVAAESPAIDVWEEAYQREAAPPVAVAAEPVAPRPGALTARDGLGLCILPGLLGSLLPMLVMTWFLTPEPITMASVASFTLTCVLPQALMVGLLLGAGGGAIIRTVAAGGGWRAPRLNVLTTVASFLMALVAATLLDVVTYLGALT